MATQWPRVVAWLVNTLPTLPGWSGVTVLDGEPISADVLADVVTVGYVTDTQSGTYSSEQDDSGYQRQETGSVRSMLSCVSGDSPLAAVRARMFALLDSLDAAIRADRTLGGTLSQQGTSQVSVDVVSVQDISGAEQSAIFTLTYFTVT